MVRVAAEMVASGRMVTGGAVISSAAVSVAGRDRRARPRRAAAFPRRAVLSCAASRSVSETTPITCQRSASTGRLLTRCSASRQAISLYGVSRSTVTTAVVITSCTVR